MNEKEAAKLILAKMKDFEIYKTLEFKDKFVFSLKPIGSDETVATGTTLYVVSKSNGKLSSMDLTDL